MRNFQRDDRRSGNKPFMHKVVCSKCGVNCEVPFKPTGVRPVFCSKCFGKQDSGARRPDRSNFRDRQQMHDAVCDKCGKNCQVPFKPTNDKPIFCDDCFRFKKDGNRGGRDSVRDSGRNSGEVMEQISLLNSKIDKLINMLTPKAVEKPKQTKKPKKPKQPKKPNKPKKSKQPKKPLKRKIKKK
ncbi:MAG: CxxC-x17-CxxC domain-containing protein [Patescibacteria group bacterium]